VKLDKNIHLNVVIVDDNKDDHYFIKKALSEYKNISFLSLYDGVSLLKYLQQKNNEKHEDKLFPDVVILDINMPRLNGFEVFAELKKADLLSDIKFFILSSSVTDVDSKMCNQFNLNCYTKPFTTTNFTHLLEKIFLEYYPSGTTDKPDN
jgi:CheY-like chemotaxis protein